MTTATMNKEPVLVVFDIDGTLAVRGDRPESEYTDDYILSLPSYPNIIDMARQYLQKRNVTVLFCSGRPSSLHGVTRRWLNNKLNLVQVGKRSSLVLRPDGVPESGVPAFKLSEILQAVRRLGSMPVEAIIFDDDVRNLRLYETLKPMVRKLRVYRADNGVVSEWSL